MSQSPSRVSSPMAALAGAFATVVSFQLYWLIRRTTRQKSENPRDNVDGDIFCDPSDTPEQQDLDSSVIITLPQWALEKSLSMMEKEYKTDQERMAVAIYLAATNVAKGTGGPFGTAIFERNVKTGITKLFAVGVNRVVPLSNSTLHGETTAIQMAQNKLKTYSLKKAGSANKNNLVEYDLYTSCEPCCMCLGATLWSGVSRMVCAATKEDAKAIGFDEGPVYDSSYDHLVNAGIEVKRGVLQKEGAEVLQNYGKMGEIYNR